MESNLKRPGGGTIAAGNRNSPPGRLRPKGSVGLRVRAPLSPRTFFYFRALPSKSTLSSHSSSALSLFIVCRRHLSLIWLRNNFLFMCWMECCAGYKQFRASFRIPFWDSFLCVFDPFPLPFSATFFLCFFMLFTSLFSMLFR